MTSRSRLSKIVAALLVALVALAACGDDSDDTTNASNPTDAPGTSEDAVSDVAADAFPVVLDTAYGEITIESKPERIVALGSQHVDILTSLGVQPVAFTDGRSTDEATMLGQYPWLEGEYTAEYDGDLATAEYKASLEAIAVHEPDLILANSWLVDEQMYEEISKIAPTFVGVVVGNNDWDVLVESLGALTGEADTAQEILDELDAAFAAGSERLPGLQGKTYNFVGYRGQNFIFGNGSWSEGLGLVAAPNQSNTDSGGNAATDISLENVEHLAADVLWLWDPQNQRASIEADPRFAQLPASQNGTVVFLDNVAAIASNSAGPKSLLWLLDKVVPELEASPLNAAG